MTRKKNPTEVPPEAGSDDETLPGIRVFKAPKFAQEAKKRGITDEELCRAIRQVIASPHTYSLGGEVYKKRLNDNMDRAILLAKGGKNWFYAHIFKKSTRDNISHQELAQFRTAAKVLGSLGDQELGKAVNSGKLREICHDDIHQKAQ